MYRGRRAPENAVYDAVNAILTDEGLIAKRGGSAYWSGSNAGNTLTRLSALYYPGISASRVTAWGTNFYAFNGTTPVDLGALATPGRPASVGGMAVFPIGAGRLAYYGGSIKAAGYNTGTVTFTQGSAVVTGAGTSWSANADAGMVLFKPSSGRVMVVKSVDSNTQLTLTAPYPSATVAGSSYTLYPILDSSLVSLPTDLPSLGGSTYVAAAGAGFPRLIYTTGNRAYLSDRGDPTRFDDEVYHELPSNVVLTGAEGVGDSCLLLTTGGVWAIDGLSFDAVDAFGNQQQTVRRVGGEIVLWGDLGVSSWAGGVIVPAVDDVYILGADGPSVTLTGARQSSWDGGIRDLYRSYVAAGYQPGMAAVHRGHYVLPVLNGSTWVDTLVCRLDRGSVWTRWSGHAAGVANAVLAGSASAGPKLLSVAGQRVTDLNGTLVPAAGNAVEADSTVPDCTITTRDFPTGGNTHGFVQRARLRYELTDGGTPDPTVALAYSSDQDAGAFTTLTEKGEQGGGTGWATSDGSRYQWALVGKRRERIRFRVTVSGACASFVLRTIELLLRPTGKQ